MQLSNTIKQRFVKDWKLPFHVVQEPIFSYMIDEVDQHFNSKYKLKLLEDVIETLGSEESFFSEANKVKNSIIQSIQLTPAYKMLQNDKLVKYDIEPNGIKQKDIYTMENVNRTFISLDLVKANFNVMKMYDNSLTLGFETYDDLVSSVTDFDYFKKSKYLRQVIFGNMLPKKQQKLQKWVMRQLIEMLHDDVGVDMVDFVSASADEVLFAIDPKDADKFVDMVKRKLKSNDNTSDFASWVRVEAFTLKSIGDKKFFVKEFLDGAIEFKGIPSFLFMQVYKRFVNKEVIKMDKMFFHEGYLASFEQGVFDESS